MERRILQSFGYVFNKPKWLAAIRAREYFISESITENCRFSGRYYSEVFCVLHFSHILPCQTPWRTTDFNGEVQVSLQKHIISGPKLNSFCDLRANIWLIGGWQTNWAPRKDSEEHTETTPVRRAIISNGAGWGNFGWVTLRWIGKDNKVMIWT